MSGPLALEEPATSAAAREASATPMPTELCCISYLSRTAFFSASSSLSRSFSSSSSVIRFTWIVVISAYRCDEPQATLCSCPHAILCGPGHHLRHRPRGVP